NQPNEEEAPSLKTLMEMMKVLMNKIEVLEKAPPMTATTNPEVAKLPPASAPPPATNSTTSEHKDESDDEVTGTLPPSPIALTHSVSEAYKRRFTGKKFDQKTTDALEWADYFRGYLATHTWDLAEDLRENVSMRMLGEALTGNIEQFWFSEIRETKKNWREILDDLEDSFTPDHVRQQAGSIDILRECKQKVGENTKIYLLRFEQALARHRRAMAKKRMLIDELLIRQVLYAGVASAKIAKAVMKAKNLTKALAAAKSIAEEESQWSFLRAEKSETMDTTSATTHATPATMEEAIDHGVPAPEAPVETITRNMTPTAPKPPSDSPADATMNALVKSMNELRIMISKQQVPTNSARPPSAPRTRTRLNKSDVVCFNCDQKGHYSNECSQPATRKTMVAQMEYGNIEAEPDAETFVGSIYLTEEDYHEYSREQRLREQDFYQGW
ncbi:hypothetical protein BGZ82_001545, partial [Podila clonocystis]